MTTVGANENFDRAVGAHAAKVHAFIRRRVRSTADADDVTQDALLKALRARGSVRDGTKLEAWLYRIARTTLVDHYRRRRPESEFADTIPADEARQMDKVVAAVAAAAQCYLGTLPEEYRAAVQFAEFEGQPHAEVARRLGISLTAAKSRVRRGKQRIRELMEQCCEMKFDRRGRVVDYVRRDGQPCRLDRE